MSPSTALKAAPAAAAIQPKFVALRDELNAEILEAEDRVDGALTALVAGMHMAQIGPPGTAKTYLVDRMVARIAGVRYYDELMRKTMGPELVFGTQSILAMKNDEPARFVTTGMLPEADIAQIDEFPRTSDAINNGLLKILNERRFKNGADIIDVPLHAAYLNANSLPVGEAEHDLEAFWDRVVLRFIVDLPKDRATWRAISRLRPDANPAALLDWSEVLVAHAASRALPILDETFDAIEEIRYRLEREAIEVTPRRCRQAQYVCAASAWLAGADEVAPVHGEILSHMLWDEPDQRVVVEKIVSEVVSPQLRLATTIADTIQDFDERLEIVLARPFSERTSETNELFDKFLAQRDEIDEAMPTMEGRALRLTEQASKHLDSLQMRLVEGMGLKASNLRNLRR